MNGKKVKKLRKMQAQCDHVVDPNKTRNSPYTQQWMRCEDCGVRLNRLQPMSAEAVARLAHDQAELRARMAKAEAKAKALEAKKLEQANAG